MPERNLFQSQLYTSNLYDSKQKSRSHLVLFETVDRGKNGDAGKRQPVRQTQTEHSNAFGYLGRPLYEKTIPKLSYNNRGRRSMVDVTNDDQCPMMIRPAGIKTSGGTIASNRNESSAVRAALNVSSSNLNHHYEHENDDDLYFNQYYYQRRSPETSVAPYRHQQNNWKHHLQTSTTGLTKAPSSPKLNIRKQNELSPDNGSYYYYYTEEQKQPTPLVVDTEYYHNHHLPTNIRRERHSNSAINLQQQASTASKLSNSNINNNIRHYPIMAEEEQPITSSQSPLPQQEQLGDFEESSQNRILIKNGKIVNDDAIFKADIYVEEGIIKDIGPHLIVPGGCKVIDANGFYVLPGGIDTHTHLDSEFMNCKTADDFYSGTRAALAGGTTTIMDFVFVNKGQSLVDAFKKRRAVSDGVACCDYTFRVAISEFINGKTDVEMETLVKEHGVNGFKIFMAYKNSFMIRDEEIISVMDKCHQLGALVLVHAENGDIIDYNVAKMKNLGITGPEGHLLSRPEEVEAEATNRVIMLGNQTNCPVFIVHVNSRSAADVIAQARNRGCIVYGEPITAGIGTDGTHQFNRCWDHAAAHVMSPPLRPDRDTADHLLNLLASGQLQTIGSDHCVFKLSDKAKGKNDFSLIPNGVNGVEERLLILWEKGVKTGKMDPRQFVAMASSNAAKIFNLYPRKGRLAKGSDADIVIWGPKPHIIRAENHHFNGDFNIFEGMSVSNGPLVVISNGRIVLDENGLHVIQGSGRYLPCAANSSYVWHSIRDRDRQRPFKVNRNGKEAAPNTNNGDQANAVNMPPPNGNFQAPLTPPIYSASPDPVFKDPNNAPAFYKGTTRSGVRNLQDSSFNLSGAQIDDDKIGKTAIRVHNPPGGRSSGIW